VLAVIAVNVGVLLMLALVGELIFGQWITGRPLGRLAVPRNVKKTRDTAPLSIEAEANSSISAMPSDFGVPASIPLASAF